MAKRYLVPEGTSRELRRLRPGATTDMVRRSLMECFGGVEEFCKEVHAEYAGAKPGSMFRMHLLRAILSMVTKDDSAPSADQLEEMTLDELKDAYWSTLRSLQSRGVDLQAEGLAPEDGPADG